MNKVLQLRIEKWSIPIPFTRCRMWLGAMGKRRGDNGHSYGAIRIGRTMTTAHRASFMAFVGPIPRGKHVLHHCDNVWCVEPSCLFLGSARTNARDKQVKGRAAVKLTADQVLEIRRLAGRETSAVIASQFGVSRATIRYVITRQIWNHV